VLALTLYQPHGQLIALGVKPIETRSWRTFYRGPIAIHVSARWPRAYRELAEVEPFRSALRPGGNYAYPELYLGQVIAIADLVDVQLTGLGGPLVADWVRELDDRTRAFGDFSPGRYGWFLENVRPLQSPVPARGGQKLWHWEPSPEALQLVGGVQ
jgi:hypothetical protein